MKEPVKKAFVGFSKQKRAVFRSIFAKLDSKK